MGKKLDPAEKAARAARRAARSDRQVQRKVNEIAATELAKRIEHEGAALSAEGFSSKRAHATGTPTVTPPSQDGQV